MTQTVVVEREPRARGEQGLAFVAKQSFGHIAFVRDGQPKVELVRVKVVDASILILVEDEGASDALGQRPVTLIVDHVDPGTGGGWAVEVTGTALDLGPAVDAVPRPEGGRAIARRACPVLLIPSAVEIRHVALAPRVGDGRRPSWSDLREER